MALDKSVTVLVVDDYKTMVRIIRSLLQQLGFRNIDDAADGASALEMIRRKDYGLIPSDWNMASMTGYELLKSVRADPATARTPFAMVAPEAKTENVVAARQSGVNNYIIKPFTGGAETEAHRRLRGNLRVDGAAAQIATIRREVEEAADTMIGAANRGLEMVGRVQAGDRGAPVGLEQLVCSILEACAFQDITGQRLGRLCAASFGSGTVTLRDPLLNGPADAGLGLDQGAADRLFEEGPFGR